VSVGCRQCGRNAPVPVGGASERGGCPVSRWRHQGARGFCPVRRVKDLLGLKTGKSAPLTPVWSGSPDPGGRYVYWHFYIRSNRSNVELCLKLCKTNSLISGHFEIISQ